MCKGGLLGQPCEQNPLKALHSLFPILVGKLNNISTYISLLYNGKEYCSSLHLFDFGISACNQQTFFCFVCFHLSAPNSVPSTRQPGASSRLKMMTEASIVKTICVLHKATVSDVKQEMSTAKIQELYLYCCHNGIVLIPYRVHLLARLHIHSLNDDGDGYSGIDAS